MELGLGRKKKKAGKDNNITGYDYRTRESRENTAGTLFNRAKIARTPYENDWQRYNDYYNFLHDSVYMVQDYCDEQNLPYYPAVLPDPWIMVESQVNPNVPAPEFRGRDDDQDSVKAKQREYAVRYIMENNRIDDMNTANERRLLKYGDAWWKAYWDPTMRCGPNEGDIRLKDIPIEAVYLDPAIHEEDFQSGQFVAYVYKLHRVRVAQLFAPELKALGIGVDDLLSSDYTDNSSLFDMTAAIDSTEDTLQVLELWYRQPTDGVVDGETVRAGGVGCTIQIGGTELRNIPNYWKNTGIQNQLFPFVKYWRIRDENRPYNKSELFAILPMVDAGDRQLGSVMLNNAMCGNDVVVVEENALADGTELINEPGAVITTKQNKIDKVRRLGGLPPNPTGTNMIGWYVEQIQRANRNFESNQGKETTRETTASGLAMLRSDANEQTDIKDADRLSGFERLFELLDWLALEFYDDDRLIYLGAKKDVREESVQVLYNSGSLSRRMDSVTDYETGETVRPEWTYYPKVDVSVTAGDSVQKGKQATLNALSQLVTANITAENYKLYCSYVKLLELPEAAEMIEDWESRFAQRQLPEQPETQTPVRGFTLPTGAEGGVTF